MQTASRETDAHAAIAPETAVPASQLVRSIVQQTGKDSLHISSLHIESALLSVRR
jgi:hypothetical protein